MLLMMQQAAVEATAIRLKLLQKLLNNICRVPEFDPEILQPQPMSYTDPLTTTYTRPLILPKTVQLLI